MKDVPLNEVSTRPRLRTRRPTSRRTQLWSTLGVCLLLSACSTESSSDQPNDTGVDASDADVSENFDASIDTAPDAVAVTDVPEHLDVPDDATATLEIDVDWFANPANPISFYVSVSAEEPFELEASVSCDTLSQTTSALVNPDAPTSELEFVVWALLPEDTCTVEMMALSESGAVGEGSVTATTRAIDETIPTFDRVEFDEASVEPGFTLVNLNNDFDGEPLRAAIIDDQGRYRWIGNAPNPTAGTDNEVAWTERGILISGNRGRSPSAIVTPAGDVVWSSDFYVHHDIRWFEELGQVAYLVDEGQCDTDFNVGGYEIRDIETDEVTESWRICEHWRPDELRADWAHLNTLVLDDTHVLLSSRSQHSLFYVERESGEVIWRLGEGGDFAMPEGSQFWRQHAPMWTAENRILLFDNGKSGERESSRALELELDFDTMEASVIWEYAPESVLFTPIWGDADRLANGNTLITFGFRTEAEGKHTTLIEVAPDGTEVWRVELPTKWGIYRADRIPVYGPRFFVPAAP